MTSRSGLRVALIGFVMAVVCLATLFFIRDWDDPTPITVENLPLVGIGMTFVLLLDLGALLGLVAMVVGLIMAAVGAKSAAS
jgi:hypothetical protein